MVSVEVGLGLERFRRGLGEERTGGAAMSTAFAARIEEVFAFDFAAHAG